MTDSYWAGVARGRRVSRRAVIRGGGVAGAGLLGAALIGCGSGDDEPAATSTTAPSASGTTAAQPTASANEPKRGGTFQTYTTVDPTSLDPYANLSFTVKGFASYVYSRLFRIDAQPGLDRAEAPITPDLAESAESADGMDWTVKLKPGAKFHNIAPVNGREITTADVVYSFERLMADGSPGKNLVPKAMTIEAIDDLTVKFRVPQPSPTMMDFFSDANLLWVLPTESESDYDLIQTPIGSGPWMMDQYDAAAKIAFKANPEYFVEGVPYLDGIDLNIIPEYANYRAQFEAGNLHVFVPQSSDILSLNKGIEKIQWEPTINHGLQFVFFSGADQDPNAPWRDERFRQAVSYAIDREALFDLQYNLKELTDAGFAMSPDWNNIIARAYGPKAWLDPKSAAQGPSAKFFEYNPEEAKKLLAAVGNTDEPFAYQYVANAYGTTFLTYAEATFNWLSEVGLKPVTDAQDYSSKYITNTFVGNFHGLAYGLQTPFPEPGSWVNRMFGDDPANNSRVNDPAINELNEKSKVELDPAARTEMFYEIQRISDSAMYYVPTPGNGGSTWTAYQPQVRGIRSTRGYGVPTEQFMYYWLDQ
ncbi:MAG: ABC transporter substrate-binding protein [Chloroflexi bacterium]|nr:ABC transporter substrate-binding protein [Chloroflexota bacterium]